MSKLILLPIKLRKLFPPYDPLAPSIARLCILREDFALELRGLADASIEVLDQHSDRWRRIYFYRRSTRTLVEIRGAIEFLSCSADFKKLLSQQTKPEQSEFHELKTRMNEAHARIKNICNTIGAHVKHESVQNALDRMQLDREGFFEVGRKLKATHYKFAVELVVEIMLESVGNADRRSRLESDFRRFGKLMEVLELIDKIVYWYMVNRHLL